MVSMVRPSSRFPSRGPGQIQARGERKAALFQEKSPPVRMENANRKGFVRVGKGMDKAQSGPQARSGQASCSLTRNRLRVSYLRKALSWNQAGTGTIEPCGFRAGYPEKAVSNRKQTAVGHRQVCGRGTEHSSRRAASGPSFQNLGWILPAARTVPGDKRVSSSSRLKPGAPAS